MRAISRARRDEGTATVSWSARNALRMRVRTSEMGSVVAMDGLPARLRHSGDEAVVGQLAQADPAHAELAVHGAGPAAAAAARIRPSLVLGRSRLAHDLRCLGHLLLALFGLLVAGAAALGWGRTLGLGALFAFLLGLRRLGVGLGVLLLELLQRRLFGLGPGARL